jgi:hypothetical protein
MSIENLFEPTYDEMAESTDCLFDTVVDLYAGETSLYQLALLTHHTDEGVASCVNDGCQSECTLEYLSNGRAVPNLDAIITAGKNAGR